MVNQTANSKYRFSDIYYDYTLYNWTKYLYIKTCFELKMEPRPLNAGSYGFDLYASIFGCILKYISNTNNPVLENAARLGHEEWSIIYKHWRDCVSNRNSRSFSERNNKLADTSYDELSDDFKNMNLVFAKAIFNELGIRYYIKKM